MEAPADLSSFVCDAIRRSCNNPGETISLATPMAALSLDSLMLVSLVAQVQTIYEVELSFVTSNLFARGHRIRVQVSSTFFPNFSRNLHTGELETTSSRMQPATIRVHHDSGHPSQISLHVAER